MHILITGGTGLIGTALCEALLAEGHQLTILSRAKRREPAKRSVYQGFLAVSGPGGCRNQSRGSGVG